MRGQIAHCRGQTTHLALKILLKNILKSKKLKEEYLHEHFGCKRIKKYYGKGESLTKTLDGVSLDIEKGEFVAIIGASGSGKSTLLKMIGGLDISTSGKVMIGGKEMDQLSADELTVFRRRNIGFIFKITT